MKYLIIILVMGLALAPLTHFLPSKRQRLIAKLREYAAVHGLFVEFRDLPMRSDRPKRSEQVIYYGKRLPPSTGEKRKRKAWLHSESELLPNGWQGVMHREPVPECSAELPENILALGIDESSCGVYWLEKGEEPAVAAIVAVLERWSEGYQRAPKVVLEQKLNEAD